jgi:membrane fusion protein, heavy metal efflux system
VTHWTAKTELYLEYPRLIIGHTSRFAVHLTRLDDFKPVDSGLVEVRLGNQNGAPETFVTDAPSKAGIFGVDVLPTQPGVQRMILKLASTNLVDLHDLGTVTVYPDAAAAARQPGEAKKEETIAFLKEQQWSLDFATEVVRERRERSSLRVPGEVRPRTGGEAEVTVPFDGRMVASNLIALGTLVRRGQVLAGVLPPTNSPADLPALEMARSEAEAALQLARRDRERAQRLLEAGAVPARRLDEARTAELTQEARLKAAEARLAQYQTTRNAEGDGQDDRLFRLRAPISGVIAETHATAEANVEAGETLFKVVDVDTVYATANVPETELSRVQQLTGAELEIPGSDRRKALGRPLSIGWVLDPASRTVSVIYQVRNQDHRLAVGQAVFLRLFTSKISVAPAAPESAVVDDGGRPVVFVQLEGEKFARRPVTLGNRESGYVQVLEGVRPGERVVTRGAYLIRLAAMSNQIPAHGHVH